jgi:hypothetical protein
MVLSAMCPFVFLTRAGRIKMGWVKPKSYSALLLAFLAGLTFSLLLYYAGQSLYGNTYQNWYAYIGKSYKIPLAINQHDKAIMFAVVGLTGMVFSPVGEELFFRGIVHLSFAHSLGDKRASIIDSSAFAITHIAHFGLVFVNDQWQLLTVPTLLWVVSMFLVSLMFFFFKRLTGSLLGAIISHSAFNLGMTYCIFYLL